MNTPARLETAALLEQSTTRVLPDPESKPGELHAGAYIHYGKYRIDGVLGRGSFAVVYAGEHVALRRKVAIKIVHITPETTRGVVQRFQQEARMAALVRHPNVLETYDSGTLPGGSPFLVLERVDGVTLASLLKRGPLPIPLVVELGRQLARGLGAIAQAGIIHRDIKPENVMLHLAEGAQPVVKIVDFGVSKHVASKTVALTMQGELIGTPQYMSPEQLRGEEIDERTDVYSLGAVLYEAVTGRPPHERRNLGDLMVAVLSEEIPAPRALRPDCPVALEEVLLRALARDRGQRFVTSSELLAALEPIDTSAAPARARAAQVGPAQASDARDAQAPDAQARDRDSTASTSQTGELERDAARRPLDREVADADEPSASAPLTSVRPPPLEDEAELPQPARARALGIAAAALFAVALATIALWPAADEQTSAASAIVHPPPPLPEAPRAPSVAAQEPPTREPPQAPSPAAASPRAARPARPARPAQGSDTASDARDGASRRAQRAGTTSPAAVEGAEEDGPAVAAPAPPAQPKPKPAAAAEGGDWEQSMRDALAALASGRAREALSLYREATRIDPIGAAGWRGMALAAARLGDRGEAQRAFAKYRDLYPGAPDLDALAARIEAMPAP